MSLTSWGSSSWTTCAWHLPANRRPSLTICLRWDHLGYLLDHISFISDAAWSSFYCPAVLCMRLIRSQCGREFVGQELNLLCVLRPHQSAQPGPSRKSFSPTSWTVWWSSFWQQMFCWVSCIPIIRVSSGNWSVMYPKNKMMSFTQSHFLPNCVVFDVNGDQAQYVQKLSWHGETWPYFSGSQHLLSKVPWCPLKSVVQQNI